MTPVLVRESLILGAHSEDDVAAHVAGEDEETARRFGWWPERSTEATVHAAYLRWADSWMAGGDTRAFAARRRTDRRLVGGCELRLRGDGAADCSWWTHADSRARGYATEAVRLLIEYARSVCVDRLTAEIALDNHASRRVATKAGFEEVEFFLEEDGTRMVRYGQDIS
jgi:RimJ/RimL family protein N-acetyltransferase